ncbi:MAG: type VI secretion system baseplate subunit TssF [Pseudomonadota bacterium]
MEEFLPQYERELAFLRRSMQAFAVRYPKIAARLAIAGEHSEDPHVERMIQSFALLSARLDVKLEDDYPEFTEAVLEALYPQYLRPFPSCAIAQFDGAALFPQLTSNRTVARGTQFTSHTGGFSFRSTYDVVIAPIVVHDARYASTAFAPTGVSLPPDTTGVLSVTLGCVSDKATLANAPERIRVYITGPRETVGAIADGLLLRATGAFVEPDACGKWKRLSHVPVTQAGFGDHESLLDDAGDAGSAMRLLMEYFAFPDKFDFVDLDLGALKRAAGPFRQITLHLAITGVHQDSSVAHRMSTLNARNLKLFCTPVINLFECDAAPIETKTGVSSYRLAPQVNHIADTQIWAVTAVRTAKSEVQGETVVPPFRSLQHGKAPHLSGPYWTLHRDERVARDNPGHETELMLVGLDGQAALAIPGDLAVRLTCTNRNRPSSLPVAAPAGDLEIDGADLQCSITLLGPPTASNWPPRSNGSLWRILEHLTPQPLRLASDGLKELRHLLRQFASAPGARARHIEAITDLGHKTIMQWIVMEPSPAFVRGLEVSLTVDEQGFVGSSLCTFASVMDRFFAAYAPAHSFVQLVLISASTGVEIRRCAPRQGVLPLL